MRCVYIFLAGQRITGSHTGLLNIRIYLIDVPRIRPVYTDNVVPEDCGINYTQS